VVSIALHVLVGAALLRVLLIPYPFTSIFGPNEQPVEPERPERRLAAVGFLAQTSWPASQEEAAWT